MTRCSTACCNTALARASARRNTRRRFEWTADVISKLSPALFAQVAAVLRVTRHVSTAATALHGRANLWRRDKHSKRDCAECYPSLSWARKPPRAQDSHHEDQLVQSVEHAWRRALSRPPSHCDSSLASHREGLLLKPRGPWRLKWALMLKQDDLMRSGMMP